MPLQIAAAKTATTLAFVFDFDFDYCTRRLCSLVHRVGFRYYKVRALCFLATDLVDCVFHANVTGDFTKA